MGIMLTPHAFHNIYLYCESTRAVFLQIINAPTMKKRYNNNYLNDSGAKRRYNLHSMLRVKTFLELNFLLIMQIQHLRTFLILLLKCIAMFIFFSTIFRLLIICIVIKIHAENVVLIYQFKTIWYKSVLHSKLRNV